MGMMMMMGIICPFGFSCVQGYFCLGSLLFFNYLKFKAR